MYARIEDFKEFMKHRQAVARAYVCGDSMPLADVSAHRDPATFFGPGGGHESGADHVLAVNKAGARHFEPGGETELEILHMSASDELAYWVGIQHATVHLADHAAPVPMSLRVTEVFRWEEAAWKLIHRHADTLVKPASR